MRSRCRSSDGQVTALVLVMTVLLAGMSLAAAELLGAYGAKARAHTAALSAAHAGARAAAAVPTGIAGGQCSTPVALAAAGYAKRNDSVLRSCVTGDDSVTVGIVVNGGADGEVTATASAAVTSTSMASTPEAARSEGRK